MSEVQSAFKRSLSQSDFDRFARLSGDDNPIHCDPAFARRSHFGATVAHGMFLYSLLYRALGEAMPGPGALQVEQELMFPNPSFAGDEVELGVVPAGLAPDGSMCFATTVSKQVGGARIVTADGRARLIAAGSALALAADARAAEAPATAAAGDDGELRGLRCGMCAAAERAFDSADLADFADLSGDHNPLHHDAGWAARQGFAGRLVPLPLLASMFSDLLGTRLPGRGTGWMKQSLRLLAPAYVGETLTAQVEITRLRPDKELVNLASTVRGGDGRLICRGDSLVLVRNLGL